MTVVQILGAAAAASTFLFVWPQVVRLARTGDVDGISVAATLWAMVAFVLWMTYAVREGLPFVLLANAQATFGFGLIVVLATRRRPVPPVVWVVATVGAAALALAALGAPTPLVGTLAVVAGSCGFVPQAVVALRESDLSGLSITTYLLIALCTSIWAVYGLAEGDIILMAPTAVILPCVLLIAARIRITAAAPVLLVD